MWDGTLREEQDHKMKAVIRGSRIAPSQYAPHHDTPSIPDISLPSKGRNCQKFGYNYSVLKSFSFIRQIFIEHLLYGSNYFRWSEYNGKQEGRREQRKNNK